MGVVIFDCADDADLRLSCQCACDEAGDARLRDAEVVLMLEGEPARMLVGDEAVDMVA